MDLMAHEAIIETLRDYDKKQISLYPQLLGSDDEHLTYKEGAKADLEYGKVNYLFPHGSGVFSAMDDFKDFMLIKHKIHIFNFHISDGHMSEAAFPLTNSYNKEVNKYLIEKYGSNIVEVEFKKWWEELLEKGRKRHNKGSQ